MGFLDRFKKKAPVNTEATSSEKEGFLGFVLLSDDHFDWQLLQDAVWEDWELKLDITQQNETGNSPYSRVVFCDNGCWMPPQTPAKSAISC